MFYIKESDSESRKEQQVGWANGIKNEASGHDPYDSGKLNLVMGERSRDHKGVLLILSTGPIPGYRKTGWDRKASGTKGTLVIWVTGTR